MPFDKQPPRWEAQGTEPPESKKNSGWAPGEKPAAGYFNWFFGRMYMAVKELQDKVAEKLALDAHTATSTGVHGATSAATASRIMQRDASGRAKVAAPAAADDIARKDTVDAHAAATTGVHGATNAATPLTIPIRDASGRFQVAAPVLAAEVARKAEVDAVSAAAQMCKLTLDNGSAKSMESGGSLDNLLTVGLSYVGTSNTEKPPGFTLGLCEVYKIVSTGYFQRLTDYTTMKQYTRYYNGTIWTSWRIAEQTAAKDQPNGYAGLDGVGKIAMTQLPTGSGKGMDADLLDGLHASDFAKSVGGTVSNGFTVSSGGLSVRGGGWVTLDQTTATDTVVDFTRGGVRRGYMGKLEIGANAGMNIHNEVSNKNLNVRDDGVLNYDGVVQALNGFQVINSGEQLAILPNGDIRQRGQVMAPTRVQAGNLEYWDSANFIPVLRQQGGTLPNTGANLNQYVTSGFYRMQEGSVNGPPGTTANYSQLIVVQGGGDTVGQIILEWGTGNMYVRTGTIPTNSWTTWKKAAGNVTVSSSAPSGGIDGDVWFQV